MSERRRGEGTEQVAPTFAAPMEFAAPDFAKVTANVVSTLSQMNSDLIAFAQTSFQNNIAAAEELRQVHSPKELVEAQMRFVRRAYDDYLGEATRIGQMVQKLSADTMEAFTSQKSA